MRPNYAQDQPPTGLTVGGTFYACDTDYRVWIEVLGIMKKINPRPKTEEAGRLVLERIHDIEKLIFGKEIDENIGDVLNAVAEFSKGYPMAPIRSHAGGTPLYSFDYDLNAIIIAIRNQSGIDLSYRCRHFHWWEFLLEFSTLSGDHYILGLMSARGYKGNDKELKRRRDDCALPEEYTDEEMEEYARLDALFS